MIRISEQAAEVMHETLVASRVDTGRTLRLKEDACRLKLELDIPRLNDRIVEHKGMAILLVDLRLEDKIGNALIDVEAAAGDPQLVIRLPTWMKGG